MRFSVLAILKNCKKKKNISKFSLKVLPVSWTWEQHHGNRVFNLFYFLLKNGVALDMVPPSPTYILFEGNIYLQQDE